MNLSTFKRANDLAASAGKGPVYVSGDHLQELFPPDPPQDITRLLSFGLIGHRPLERSMQDKLSEFCRQKRISFRAYHDSKHFVIYPLK